MKTPVIPMLPEALPQQHVVGVLGLPVSPDDIEAHLYTRPARKLPIHPSKNAKYLCQVEWAWSPAHSRISAYYLHKGRTCWVLWNQYYDDNWGRWDWNSVASVPRKGSSEFQAAVHLLRSAWQKEYKEDLLDRYHWINDEGLLQVAHIEAISRLTWR